MGWWATSRSAFPEDEETVPFTGPHACRPSSVRIRSRAEAGLPGHIPGPVRRGVHAAVRGGGGGGGRPVHRESAGGLVLHGVFGRSGPLYHRGPAGGETAMKGRPPRAAGPAAWGVGG